MQHYFRVEFLIEAHSTLNKVIVNYHEETTVKYVPGTALRPDNGGDRDWPRSSVLHLVIRQ